MEKKTLGGIAVGLAIGAAIGAGLGLLYAPQSGRKTRRDIQKQAMEIKDKAEDLGDEVKKRAEEIGHNFTSSAEKARRKVEATIS